MIKEETERTIVATIGDLEAEHHRYPSLSFMGGPSMGRIYLLKEGEHRVGRNKEASIVVSDDAISRQHFSLTVTPNQVLLKDLGSTNGTFVNGVRVTSYVLKDKDTVQISSKTIITFSYVSDLEAQRQNQVYQMANFDPITQARTRQYFLDQFKQEFAHARRRGTGLCLIFLDIDFFKKINDTYGHPAGDYTLKRISDITHQVIRTEDLFARYGGEEFVILMRDTREIDAIRLAERLRKLVAATQIDFDGHHLKVTLSAGVASLDKGNFNTLEEMVKAADQYLYFSKQNGRNRVSALSLLTSS